MRIGAHTTSNYLARADVAGSRVSDAQDYPDAPKNRDIGDIKQNPFSSSIPNVGPKKQSSAHPVFCRLSHERTLASTCTRVTLNGVASRSDKVVELR